MITPHALYQGLGSDNSARRKSCRELFRSELEPGLPDEDRKAANGDFVLGDNRFAGQVPKVLGRRVQPGKSGRPRKKDDVMSGDIL